MIFVTNWPYWSIWITYPPDFFNSNSQIYSKPPVVAFPNARNYIITNRKRAALQIDYLNNPLFSFPVKRSSLFYKSLIFQINSYWLFYFIKKGAYTAFTHNVPLRYSIHFILEF